MPDSSQFGRVVIVEIADLLLEARYPTGGLRVAFDVARDKTEIPNSMELGIWGLKPETRAGLEHQPEMVCKLQAGYGEAPGLLFQGFVGRAESERDRNTGDVVLRVSAGDGQDKYQRSKVNLVFAAGTPLLTVATKLVEATGLGVGNIGDLAPAFASGGSELEGPYHAKGAAVFELQEFLDSVGIDWSFQDGQFVGAATGQPYNGQGPLLSKDTGLLWARLDEFGNVEGESLMYPDLIPGTGFRVESEKATGDFVCVQSTHTGDTHGESNWNVSFHGIPLGATSDGLLPAKTAEDATPSAAAFV